MGWLGCPITSSVSRPRCHSVSPCHLRLYDPRSHLMSYRSSRSVMIVRRPCYNYCRCSRSFSPTLLRLGRPALRCRNSPVRVSLWRVPPLALVVRFSFQSRWRALFLGLTIPLSRLSARSTLQLRLLLLFALCHCLGQCLSRSLSRCLSWDPRAFDSVS